MGSVLLVLRLLACCWATVSCEDSSVSIVISYMSLRQFKQEAELVVFFVLCFVNTKFLAAIYCLSDLRKCELRTELGP
jgi:hypothetical protein